MLLYLLVTMAPLAVLAPLVGPAVDRFRGRPQLVAAACYLLRAVFCVLLANSLFQLSFYAFAIGLLISSKASGVVKQALVPLVTDDPDRLVSTNATLARMSTVCGGVGGASAAGVLAWVGASWVLRVGAVLFVIAAAVIWRLQTRPPDEPVHRTVEYAEMHLPTVLVGSIGFHGHPWRRRVLRLHDGVHPAPTPVTAPWVYRRRHRHLRRRRVPRQRHHPDPASPLPRADPPRPGDRGSGVAGDRRSSACRGRCCSPLRR